MLTNEQTGDMIDNDCDRFIDEEQCNGIGKKSTTVAAKTLFHSRCKFYFH